MNRVLWVVLGISAFAGILGTLHPRVGESLRPTTAPSSSLFESRPIGGESASLPPTEFSSETGSAAARSEPIPEEESWECEFHIRLDGEPYTGEVSIIVDWPVEQRPGTITSKTSVSHDWVDGGLLIDSVQEPLVVGCEVLFELDGVDHTVVVSEAMVRRAKIDADVFLPRTGVTVTLDGMRTPPLEFSLDCGSTFSFVGRLSDRSGWLPVGVERGESATLSTRVLRFGAHDGKIRRDDLRESLNDQSRVVDFSTNRNFCWITPIRDPADDRQMARPGVGILYVRWCGDRVGPWSGPFRYRSGTSIPLIGLPPDGDLEFVVGEWTLQREFPPQAFDGRVRVPPSGTELKLPLEVPLWTAPVPSVGPRVRGLARTFAVTDRDYVIPPDDSPYIEEDGDVWSFRNALCLFGPFGDRQFVAYRFTPRECWLVSPEGSVRVATKSLIGGPPELRPSDSSILVQTEGVRDGPKFVGELTLLSGQIIRAELRPGNWSNVVRNQLVFPLKRFEIPDLLTVTRGDQRWSGRINKGWRGSVEDLQLEP